MTTIRVKNGLSQHQIQRYECANRNEFDLCAVMSSIAVLINDSCSVDFAAAAGNEHDRNTKIFINSGIWALLRGQIRQIHSDSETVLCDW